MSNKLYDYLKFFCLTISPALIVFINAVLPSLNVPADTIKTITTIVSSLATFIGTILGITSTTYATTQVIKNSEIDEAKPLEEQSADKLIIEETTQVEFHGKKYTLTGNDIQILGSYPYSDEEYDYVEQLYGDGQTKTFKSKAYKTDEEREARYDKLTNEHPDWYPVKWAYDTELTLAENFSVAKGQTTKEDILQKK